MRLLCGNCNKIGKLIIFNELYRCGYCNKLNFIKNSYGVTSVDKKHSHNYEMNKKGNGQTIDTLPSKYNHPHTHKINNFEVESVNGHTHKLHATLKEPGESQSDKESFIIETGRMDMRTYINLKEMAGFNYTDYLVAILDNLKTDNFVNLAAKTEEDISKGMLTSEQIEQLRVVLKTGFTENLTINDIEQAIKGIGIKDLTTDTSTISADNRAINIARTETVRLANEGLIDLYTDNDIKQVQWLAALSDRTCEECAELNGQIFEINDVEAPPLHAMCRCSLLSVQE